MANEIYKISVNNTNYDVVDNRIITLQDNSTTTAGAWKAKTDKITTLADGQMFYYKIVKAGASTTTLTITNSAGTSLGAKTIYRYGTTKLTTEYIVGEYLLLSYNSTNDCFRLIANYSGSGGGGSGSNEWTLLWTNASPTSSFAAQTLTLSSSGYTKLAITLYQGETIIIDKSNTISKLIDYEYDDGDSVSYHRSITTVSDTKLVFAACRGTTITGSGDISSATKNGSCKPYKIYGFN